VVLELIFEALEMIFKARWIFFGSLERQKWPLGVAGSLPLAVGVDRGHPQWPDLSFFFFFFFFFAEKVAGGGWQMAVGGGVHRQRWVIYLVA
jgi:hypothetical protein